MKILAAVFAGIALLAALLGFGMNVIPFLSLLGKTAAVVALAGFVMTATAHVLDEVVPLVEFDAGDIHP